MSNVVPIETALGYFRGRDCIFLDHITFHDNFTTLELDGDINGVLCSIPQPDRYIPYSLRFRGILAVQMIELDSDSSDGESCFDEVVASQWVLSLGGKATIAHRHFSFVTYDHVFQVVAESYEFEVSTRYE